MDYNILSACFLLSFVLSSLLAGFFLKHASRFTFGKRVFIERVKLHGKGVPRLGGLAIALAFYISLFIFFIFHPSILWVSRVKVVGILIASLIILLCGAYDDLVKRLTYKTKLLYQILAALILVFAGYNIQTIASPFGGIHNIEILAVPAVVLWLLAMMNAINLIDGLDGLACGIAAISSLTFLVINMSTGHLLASVTTVALIGASLAFLRYNFNPARLFLGDSGSLFLGLMLGVLALDSAAKRFTVISLAIPLITLIIPIASVIFTFSRRISSAKNPFKPDRWHLHYRFIKAGMSHKNTVLVFYAVSLIFCVLGVLCYFLPRDLELIVLFCSGILMWLLYLSALNFISRMKRVKHRKRAASK